LRSNDNQSLFEKEDVLNMMSDTGMSWVKNLEEIGAKQIPPAERLSIIIRTDLQYVDENQDFLVFWYQETKNLTIELRKNLFDAAEFMANDIVVSCDVWAFRRWYLKKIYT